MVCAPQGRAEPVDGGTSDADVNTRPRQYVNLRAGLASSSGLGNAVMCLEVSVPSFASVESCGTGRGLFGDSGGRDIVHLRMNVPVASRATLGGWGSLRAGLGIAKLEAGIDRPGFPFGDPDPVTRGAVAGPDAALSIQWMRPAGRGFEWIASGTAGLAWFAGADHLIVPQDHFQPYLSIEVGAGW